MDEEGSDSGEDDLSGIVLPEILQCTTALSIRNAAHTLQLAVKDFLDIIDRKLVIDRFRQIVKMLRTPL